MSLGTALREARKTSGYSLEQIAEKTRIRVALLKALESENFEAAGGVAYARAHIRTIAKVIGADIDLLVTEFEKCIGDDSRPMIELLEENNATTNRPARTTHKVSYKFMASVAAVIVGGFIVIPSAASVIKSTTKVSQKTQSSKKSSATSADISLPTQQANSIAASKGLVISAGSASSWLWVGDGTGTEIFSGLLKSGESRTFDSMNNLNVTLGNAGAVQVTLDGKTMPSVGSAGEVVRLRFTPGADPVVVTQKR